MAGYTAVTAVVKDPSGNLYSGGRWEAIWINQSSSNQLGLINGSVFSTFTAGQLDSFGNLSAVLADNNIITPSPSKWNFNIIDSTGKIAFSTLITITGTTQDITATLQAAAAPLNFASAFQAITATSILVTNLEGVRYADRFPGADGGAQIIAAIADAPSGGIVDARNLVLPFINSTMTISKPLTLYLPTGQVALNAGIVIASDGVSILGTGISPNLTPVAGSTCLVLNTGTVTGITVNSGAFGATVKNMTLIGGVVRTAGAAIQVNGSGGTYDKIRIQNTFNGIVIGLGGQGTFSEVVTTTDGNAGTMNIGLLMGPTTVGNTINSSNFVSCQWSAGNFNAWADAMVVLDSGVDTPIFTDCQFVQNSVKALALNIRNTSTANDPEWAMFTCCAFEGGQTFDGIKIDAVRSVTFYGCTVNGKRGFNITGGRDIRIESNQIYRCANEGVLITGGTGITMLGNTFGDNSLAANNTSDDIFVNAAINGFDVIGNRFMDVAGDAPANKPRFNLNIGNAGATNFNIGFNNAANSTAVSGVFSNSSATGAWNIWAWQPTSIGNDIRATTTINGTFAVGGGAMNIPTTGLIAVYKSIATVSGGVPAEYATVDTTTNTGNVGLTTAYAVPAGGQGMYRVSGYVIVNRVATTSSTLPNLQLQWTDPDNSTVQNLSFVSGTPTGNVLTTFFNIPPQTIMAKLSTNIQYQTGNSTAYASVGGTTMQYSIHLKVEAL